MEIEPIAIFRSPFASKFGVPRQSGIVESLTGRIEIVSRFHSPEALRGLSGFDYLWIIWGFSENVDAPKHPTVRPPLLGGNERVGVWATRSPFRPNNLGLSSVRIAAVNEREGYIDVLGADLKDGTPVFDIKPYLPYVDSHPDARGGFTDDRQWQRLRVVMGDDVRRHLSAADAQMLSETLSLDPRPHYHDADGREYVMPFLHWEIVFSVTGRELTVLRLRPLSASRC